jgi:phage shock protein A
MLATHLKKFFPGRDEIARLYVSQKKFSEEMHKLRDDLHGQLASSSQNTDRLLRRGINALRNEVNGMGPRIQTAHDKASSAEGVARSALDTIRRAEADFGALRSEMRTLSDAAGKIREDVGFIKGQLGQSQPRKTP